MTYLLLSFLKTQPQICITISSELPPSRSGMNPTDLCSSLLEILLSEAETRGMRHLFKNIQD